MALFGKFLVFAVFEVAIAASAFYAGRKSIRV